MTNIDEIIIECTPDCDCHQRLQLMYHAGIQEDVSEYNLEQRYAHFNDQLFAKMLPDIPIIWKKMKTAGGRVIYRVTNTEPQGVEDTIHGLYKGKTYYIVPGTLKMEISDLYRRSDKALDALLLHEMIHVYFAVKGMFQEQHGPNFVRMARAISGTVGFEVPMKDEVDGLELMSEDTKEVGVILFQRGENRYSFAIISPKLLPQALNKPLSSYINVYRINTKIWTMLAMKYPVQRVINHNLKTYFLTDKEAIDDLRQNGDLLTPPRSSDDA